jgi:hypothetical protein
MPPADPVPRSECRYEGLCPAGPLSAIGSRDTIDLLAGRSRKLPHIDPTEPEMLISCGAALSGLRSVIREMGYLPDVQLLPDPAQTDLLDQERRCCTDHPSRTADADGDAVPAYPPWPVHRRPAAPRPCCPDCSTT